MILNNNTIWQDLQSRKSRITKIIIMSFFVKESLNDAGMVDRCAWCGGPVVGKGEGRIWLGSRQTYCSPKCRYEAEQAERK